MDIPSQVARVQSGDIDAFTPLYNHFFPIATKIAVQKGFSYDEALDLAQEAMIRAYRNINSYQPTYQFSTWVTRILQNVIIDRVRYNNRRPASVELSDVHATTSMPTSDLADIVLKVTASIDHSLVLGLYAIHDMSYIEIGQLLQIPMGTVKSRINRARKEIKCKLTRRKLLPAS